MTNSGKDIIDLRFQPDVSGAKSIFHSLPGLEDWSLRDDLRDYMSLSLGADSIKVTPEIFPRESRVFQEVLKLLKLSPNDHQLFLSGSDQRNAYIASGSDHSQMVISAALVNMLDEDELRFVIGHEFGHFLCQHSKIPTGILISSDEIGPPLKKDILRWSRCAEISADRFGVFVCGKLEASLSALYKVAFGLKPPRLDVLRKTMRSQYEELVELSKRIGQGSNKMGERTHPIIPLRCVAIEITFMDIQSYKSFDSWNKSSIGYIDNQLMNVVNNLL